MRDFEEWRFKSQQDADGFLRRHDVQNDYSLVQLADEVWSLVIFHDFEEPGIRKLRPTPILDALIAEFNF
jgi:hypothetical protein